MNTTDTAPFPSSSPMLSVVAPMFNEEGGAAALIDEIAAALHNIDHEIIIVDDGSNDGTKAALRRAREKHPQLRILAHEKNAGQSRALRTGVAAARATIVATLDGDGQNDPGDISSLHQALTISNAPQKLKMVAGERLGRKDSAAKRWASKAANAIRKKLLRDGADDTGCGLKVFYRDAFLQLPYFDHMHRYLPALMRREGYDVQFLPVSHRPRVHGASKYSNFGRFLVAFRDLTGVIWLLARAKSPGKVIEDE